MKKKNTTKGSRPSNYGNSSSQRVLVMSIVNEVTSSEELQGIILPMRLLLAMKQRRGLRLTAQVSISIFRESVKTGSTTLSSGIAQSGVSATNGAGSFVQTTLPLTYPTSGRKRKSSA